MWIKTERSPIYKIIIDDDVIDDVSKDIYDAHIEYSGSGEDEGYFILSTSFNKYIITNQIGDDIKFTSNIPQLADSVGDYYVDRTKNPIGDSTIYTNGNGEYCGINFITYIADSGLGFVRYGKYITRYNSQLEAEVNDRAGNYISFRRYITSYAKTGFVFDEFKPIANIHTHLLLLQSESDSGLGINDLRDAAKVAFDANNYFYKFGTANKWSGWFSSSITGEYTGFGDASGTRKVGHFRYLDEHGSYVKGDDIVEIENEWIVTYKENGFVYKTQSEPQDSDAIFYNNEADPQQITLNFDDYVSYEFPVNKIEFGVDVI